MSAYLAEWLNLLARWLHFITGVAWIGASFYFIWLDDHLEAPKDPAAGQRGVGGELWSVHGGGFYHAQKYRVAPRMLPETLHWFKWEAYSTWLSGMFLLMLVYWYGAEVYLIDPKVAALTPTAAVAIAVAVLAGSWVIYDLLCRSPLGRHDGLFAAVLFLLVSVLAFSLCQLYSGRGAYIHFGAVLGTIMVANVFFVIIPGQRRMVQSYAAGIAASAEDGTRAKQRSVHNTYFTLPVLFTMISNHYALTYAHAYNWLILIAITLAGALIRVYFVARHKGRASPLPILVAVLLVVGVAAAIAPTPQAGAAQQVTLDKVRPLIESRCAVCHSASPSHIAFSSAPAGVKLDTEQEIVAAADRIHQQTVVLRTMPIGNLTHMSDEERALIDAWYRSRHE